MNGLPATWVFTAVGGGGTQLSITVPAAVGRVSHVVTGIEAALFTSGVSVAFNPLVQVFDGVTSIGNALVLNLDGLANGEIDRASWDAALKGTPGTLLKVTFNAATPANMGSFLKITGYEL